MKMKLIAAAALAATTLAGTVQAGEMNATGTFKTNDVNKLISAGVFEKSNCATGESQGGFKTCYIKNVGVKKLPANLELSAIELVGNGFTNVNFLTNLNSVARVDVKGESIMDLSGLKNIEAGVSPVGSGDYSHLSHGYVSINIGKGNYAKPGFVKIPAGSSLCDFKNKDYFNSLKQDENYDGFETLTQEKACEKVSYDIM